jgi:pimeloyl-ACP methyl ester carboxylesterase
MTEWVIQGPATEHFLEIDGVRVRFVSAGRGPALVLVHGLLGYSFSWRFAIPILAHDRQVFAVDMPGSGFSDSPVLHARLTAAARRLSRFLDAAGISSCDLAGSSYGGTTALRLATLEPARVRSLILIAPANPWSRIGRKRLAALGIPGVDRFFPFASRNLRLLHRYFVHRMYGDVSRITQETLDGYSLPLVRPGVFEHAVKIAKSWTADMRELRRELPKASNIPVLILWGSKDRLVEQSSAEMLSRNFRVNRTVVLDGAGHLPYEEVPEEFCQPVLDFLETYSPAAVRDGK